MEYTVPKRSTSSVNGKVEEIVCDEDEDEDEDVEDVRVLVRVLIAYDLRDLPIHDEVDLFGTVLHTYSI